MKQSTQEFLIDYIINHKYGKYSDYDFLKLFKMFSALEIFQLSDINKKIAEFCDFLEEHHELINTADPAYKERIPCRIATERRRFFRVFNINYKEQQKIFADVVSMVTPSKHSRVLDVGPSAFPYSSIIMAQKLNHVTAMDKSFFLSNESHLGMNVLTEQNLFEDNTSIDDYDFVVGRFPCSAIVPIVKLCAKTGKPYFIELCSCNMPTIQESPDGWYGWEDILPAFDPNIKVIDGYAYNIDATPVQVSRFVKRFSRDKKQSTKNGIFLPEPINISKLTPNTAEACSNENNFGELI